MRRTRRPDSNLSAQRPPRYKGLKGNREEKENTSHISYSWTSEHSDQFGRRSSIVADGDDITQRTVFAFSDRIEYVDQIVGSASAGEDHYARIHDHTMGAEYMKMTTRCEEV
jgi:hypothetical protein